MLFSQHIISVTVIHSVCSVAMTALIEVKLEFIASAMLAAARVQASARVPWQPRRCHTIWSAWWVCATALARSPHASRRPPVAHPLAAGMV